MFLSLGLRHRITNRSPAVTTVFKRFIKDDSGATAIEYGLIAAIVAIGLIASLQGLKNNLSSTFSKVGSRLNTAN
jgi:pilus assembly protein Flp/PilA